MCVSKLGGQPRAVVGVGKGREKRLLLQKSLSGQRGVVGRHETHAGAARDEIAVDYRERPGFVGLEDVRVSQRDLLLHHLLSLLSSRADNPVDGTDRRYAVLVADAVLEQAIADLPSKDARIFLLVLFDLRHDLWRGNFWFAPSYNSRFY